MKKGCIMNKTIDLTTIPNEILIGALAASNNFGVIYGTTGRNSNNTPSSERFRNEAIIRLDLMCDPYFDDKAKARLEELTDAMEKGKNKKIREAAHDQYLELIKLVKQTHDFWSRLEQLLSSGEKFFAGEQINCYGTRLSYYNHTPIIYVEKGKVTGFTNHDILDQFYIESLDKNNLDAAKEEVIARNSLNCEN